MKPAHGEPHDHGSSWAIYGLAEGDTEMTDWKVVRKGPLWALTAHFQPSTSGLFF